MRQPGRRVELHHDRGVVHIGHEPAEAIVLAVDQPVPGGGPRCQERPTPGGGDGEAVVQPCLVDDGRPAGVEHPDANGRCRIPQPDGEKSAIVIEHHRQVARGPLVAHGLDRPIEEPRVPTPELAFGVTRHPYGKTLLVGNGERFERWDGHRSSVAAGVADRNLRRDRVAAGVADRNLRRDRVAR